MADKELTIVIPVKDDERIFECLESIDDNRAQPLVVFNGSSAGFKQRVKKLGINCLCLETANPSKACEYGVQMANTAAVLLMDSDCTFIQGSLCAIIQNLKDAPLVTSEVSFDAARRFHNVVSRSRALHVNSKAHINKVPLAVKKTILPLIGGYLFDPRLGWTEDIDLTFRLRKVHIPIVRMRAATVRHPAISPFQDLQSMFNYGMGTFTGYALHIEGYYPLSFKKASYGFLEASRKLGFDLALYCLLCNYSQCLGYSWNRFRDANNNCAHCLNQQ